MSAPAIVPGVLRERILAAVRESKRPVTFKGLAKLVKAKEAPFRAELESVVSEAQVHRWPDYRRSQYFWHLSPEEKAREVILAVASTQALSKADLSKAAAKNLPGFPLKRVETEVSALVRDSQLQELPSFASNSKVLARAGDHGAYFSAARSFVERKIRLAGFDPVGLFADNTSSNESPATGRPDAAVLILEAVQSLEPVRGVPVSTLRLRDHLKDMPKHEFDVAALELRKKQEVFLSQHADPYNVSQEDKDLLIDGQDGTYYVAIAIR
jgi:hypothetical protein